MAHASIKSPTLQLPSRPSVFELSSGPPSTSGFESDSADSDAPLPFPAALPRSDFLAPTFHAATYLSDLPHRHQTLEDLRADLRERSAAISAELLDLVNGNYTAFLSLGRDLRGGDDRVGDVRVAMLGFRRAVDEVAVRVRARGDEVQSLSSELKGVRSEIEVGRRMLEMDERLAVLEDQLALGSGGAASGAEGSDLWAGDESEDDEDDEDEDEDGGLPGSSPAKLAGLARQLVRIERLADLVGRDTPLVGKMEARMTQCRNTMLLDLSNALHAARSAGPKGHARMVRFLSIYSQLGAEADAIKALRSK